MEHYIEERLLPYLAERKAQLNHKQKINKGLILAGIIVLVCAFSIYLLGINIPVLFTACFILSATCFASSCLLIGFDFLFYANHKKLAKHIAQLEELMQLAQYKENCNEDLITSCESLIKEANTNEY